MSRNLELGPCMLYFGTAGAEEALGYTQGGVTIRFLTDYADLMSDQDGSRPQERVIVGQGAEIEAPLAEVVLEKLAVALGQHWTVAAGSQLVVGEKLLGTKLTTKAESLLMKKYVDGVVSAEAENWMRFPKAAPTAESIELMFNATDQRTLPITFFAFFDDDDVLYYLGDESIGWS
jgi:hypothetical protein